MTTQEKREFNLTLVTESSEIYKFLSKMDAKEFISIHQDNFKDHYLSEPVILLDNSVFDDLELGDIISEKYREFFENIGIEETYKWLNPSLYSNYSSYLKTEDFSMDMINYEVFGLECEDDELIEESCDMFSNLYFDTCSGWGLSHFIIDIVELYYDYKNSLVLAYK